MILPLPKGAYANAKPEDLSVFAKFNRMVMNFLRIKKIQYETAFEGKTLVIPGSMQTKHHHTARIADANGRPLATLIESKFFNVYYHDDYDYLWKLTSYGFMKLRVGSKNALVKNGLTR